MKTQIQLYHGTQSDFELFSADHFNSGCDNGSGFSAAGFFFTPDEELAELFAGRRGRVIEVDVQFSRPISFDVDELFAWDDDEGCVLTDAGQTLGEYFDRGYDCIIIEPASDDIDELWGLGGEFKEPQYIIRKPEQITIK